MWYFAFVASISPSLSFAIIRASFSSSAILDTFWWTEYDSHWCRRCCRCSFAQKKHCSELFCRSTALRLLLMSMLSFDIGVFTFSSASTVSQCFLFLFSFVLLNAETQSLWNKARLSRKALESWSGSLYFWHLNFSGAGRASIASKPFRLDAVVWYEPLMGLKPTRRKRRKEELWNKCPKN